MDTTDEWKHLVEIKDTVRQLEKDNDQLKQKIDTLSKENMSALSRYMQIFSFKLSHLFTLLLKYIEIKTMYSIVINLLEPYSSLLLSNKRLENGNGQMLLATDESKRWQEKIKELQNEIGDLRRDLSKQKEDAIKR